MTTSSRAAPVVLAALLAFTANPSAMAGTSVRDAEIDGLLDAVEHSDCSFERNGRQYDGPRARKHLQRKRDYLGDRLTSAEDFIRYAATESSRSGKPYLIICAGETTPSAATMCRERRCDE